MSLNISWALFDFVLYWKHATRHAIDFSIAHIFNIFAIVLLNKVYHCFPESSCVGKCWEHQGGGWNQLREPSSYVGK